MTVATYKPSQFSSSTLGGGDNASVNWVGTSFNSVYENTTWLDNTITIGEESKLWGNDNFLKYHLGPTDFQKSQLVIPKGSTINSLSLTFQPSVNDAGSNFFIFLACLVKSPTVATINSANSWFDKEVTSSEHPRWHMASEIKEDVIGGRVDDPTDQVTGVGVGTTTVRRSERLGSGDDPDEGIHSWVQKNRITVLTGGDAVFDEIEIDVARVGSPTGDIWVEVWTGPPSEAGVGTGTKIAESIHQAANTLPTAIGTGVSFTFTGGDVNAGTGAQTVYCWLTGDFSSSPSVYVTVGAVFKTSVQTYPMSVIGRGSGFMSMPYAFRHDLPHVTGAEDDTENANIFGSTDSVLITSAWTVGTPATRPFAKVLIQEWIDDPGYVEGEPIGFVIDIHTTAQTLNRQYYASPNLANGGPILTIDFDAPLASRVKKYGF